MAALSIPTPIPGQSSSPPHQQPAAVEDAHSRTSVNAEYAERYGESHVGDEDQDHDRENYVEAEDHHQDQDRPTNLPPSSTISESPAAAAEPRSFLHLSFDQDYGCFAAGTDRGFRIYKCDPFHEISRRDFDDGVFGMVEMLVRRNIIALVRGGPLPQYPLNKVMIWNYHKSRCIGERSFRSKVRAMRLQRDRIIVVLEQKIFVYNLADLELLHQIETIANPKGLCAVSQLSESLVLVCPGQPKGRVMVEYYPSKEPQVIKAHESSIACFALTHDGRLLATASTKGTLVRVFNTIDGTLMKEFRRGADTAEIYSLAFSANEPWLAVSSDKGTVHVFSLKVDAGSSESNNLQSASDSTAVQPSSSLSLSIIKGVLPKYFSSEWSFAQFRLHEGSQYVAAFGHQKNTVVILGMDGSFYRCQFDSATGGEMTQLEFYDFLKPEVTFPKARSSTFKN